MNYIIYDTSHIFPLALQDGGEKAGWPAKSRAGWPTADFALMTC